KKPDEDIRLPMQWTGEANGGFTIGRPWRALNADYAAKNVAAQTDDPDSLLSHYRALINLRNNHAALRVGDFYLVVTGASGLFASVRATRDEIILVIVNMSRDTLTDYKLSLDSGPLAVGEYLAAPLLDGGPFAVLAANASGGFDAYQPLPELPVNAQIVIQLQPQK
ncbi:MAG: alpha-amylase, partial [Chloroflexota bacterium]